MKITRMTFDGTPEEFKAIADVFLNPPEGTGTGEISKLTGSIAPKIPDKEAFRAMLKRRIIPQGQQNVYKTLSGGELEFNEYLRRMGKTRLEIGGVHGALGNRINKTEEIKQAGLPDGIDSIIIFRKDGDDTYISLKSDFLEVLKEEGII